jgi:hypothetical protein
MAENPQLGMILDGIATSELVDSSGEILDIAGCDISDLQTGEAILNYEHNPNKDPTKNVGKVLGARKIFSREDCENERQLYYWDKLNGNSKTSFPFIYIIGRLFDGSGHEQAKALAAQIRDYVANGEKIVVRFSIEGSTLERQGNRLVSTIARDCALTLKPCNKTCDSGVIYDPQADSAKLSDDELSVKKQEEEMGTINLGYSPDIEFVEFSDILNKTEDPKTNLKEDGLEEITISTAPQNIESSAKEETPPLFENSFSVEQLFKNKIAIELLKALVAGNSNAAPSELSGGSSLIKDPLKKKKNKKIFHKAEVAFLETYNSLLKENTAPQKTSL